MQWVILLGSRTFSLADFSGMQFPGKTALRTGTDWLQVEYPDGYAVFEVEKNCEDYEPEELETLPYAPDTRMILLKYSSPAILRKIVGEAAFPEQIFIDCDGVRLGLETVIAKERLLHTEMPSTASKFEYLKWYWRYIDEKTPVLLFYEVDLQNERYATRMTEVFPDRSAVPVIEEGFPFITEEPIPIVEEINREPEFFAEIISKEEFEAVYHAAFYPGSIAFPEKIM